MAHVLSEDAKLYYNFTATHGGAGTYTTPDWDEISNVKDLTLTLDKGEIDVSVRSGNGFAEFVDGLIDATVDFQMLWDTADVPFSDIQAAFFAKNEVEILVLDGASTSSGAQGLRVTCMVKSFSRSETLGEALMVDVSLRPVKNSNAAPAWYTVP